MGTYVMLAALDEAHRAIVREDADALVEVARRAARDGRGDWVLRVGKVDDRIVCALTALTDRATGDALWATETGTPVGAEHDELLRAHYLTPDQVASIAVALVRVLEHDLVPRPTADGLAPDPRTFSDARFADRARALARHVDPTDAREMTELRSIVRALRDHYSRAARRGDGMLAFIR